MIRVIAVASVLALGAIGLAQVHTHGHAHGHQHKAPTVSTPVPVAPPAVEPLRSWAPVTENDCVAPQHENPSVTHPQVAIQVTGVPGADVSEYEGNVDWKKLGAQKKFVIMRFSHGAHLDTNYSTFWPAAKQVGVIRGAYHYVDPLDPLPFADQLTRFVNGVKLEKGDLAPIIDLENPCLWVHMSTANRLQYVLKWANALEKVYKVKPILYMSPGFVDMALGGPAAADVLKNYPLWIANYHVVKPYVPAPFTSYIMWQWAEDAPLAGVSMPADADVAPGTLADLRKYTLTQDAGGDATVLSKDDLDDQGLTKAP